MLFLKKIWLELLENLIGNHRNTSSPLFFKLNNESPLLSPKKKEQYYHATAKIFWASQRRRHNMKLDTGFLCPRVQSTNANDWETLTHVIGCLCNIRCLRLMIAIDNDDDIIIHVDRAHAAVQIVKGVQVYFLK